MKLLQAALAATALTALSMQAYAVTEDNFLAKTTGDMVALCSAGDGDAYKTAALNFCHGFVVGAYRVIAEEQVALGKNRAFCPPATPPNRNESIAAFVQWANADPTIAALEPTDGMVKFLIAKFPCNAK
jgi:hypothetical protein